MATVFTRGDVQRYYELIQLPKQYHSCPPNLELLQNLHVYQISALPYENLSIHYSPSHQTIIDPREAFNKFLTGRGRGGYCMEIGIFYLHMLRAIGFNAYHTAVRTRLRANGVPYGEYPGLSVRFQ
jgi:arylamine N-acetyltransferase